MKTKTSLPVIGGLLTLSLFFACSKDNSHSNSNASVPAGQSRVSVYMMDDPVQFSKVLIDIRQVTVLVDTATGQNTPDDNDQWDDSYCGWHRGKDHPSLVWDTLNITPGVYDLLQLRNGADTLLASGNYPSGKILKVRVTLGSDNKIYTDSTTSYPLEVFGPNPFFTVNVRRVNVSSVSDNEFRLWLDFNLSRSVFFWNGTYLLKPYITVFNDQQAARIQGQVLPAGASPLVTVFNSTDTLYALPNWDGKYLLRGVPAGNYSITFKGHHGYQDTTITGIAVDSAQTTKVPDITLHK